MLAGAPDLALLVIIFIALQAWWIIPLIKKNNKLNLRGKELSDEIRRLEKLYKK